MPVLFDMAMHGLAQDLQVVPARSRAEVGLVGAHERHGTRADVEARARATDAVQAAPCPGLVEAEAALFGELGGQFELPEFVIDSAFQGQEGLGLIENVPG